MAHIARWLFGLVIAATLLGQPPAAIQNVTHGEYLQISTADNWKWSPAVAYDPNHDLYLVVWEAWWPGTNHHEIYGRMVSGRGGMGSEFVVYSGTYNSLQPSVAFDTQHNRYLVAWSYDSAGDGLDNDIYGRFIPWNGLDPTETAFGIDSSRSNTDKPRAVYALTPDEFFLVWKVESSPSYIAGGILYDNKTGKPVAISTDGMEDDFPDVTYNLYRNEFMVVWDVDVTRTNFDLDIYGIRLDYAGTPQYPGEIPLATLSDIEEHPTVASCYQSGQYFIAWQRQVDPVKPDWNIYGRFMNGDGNLDAIYGFAGTTLPQRNARLACNFAGNEYFLAWDDMYGANFYPRIGIWAEMIGMDEVIQPAFEVVRPSETKDRLYPAVAYGKFSALVVWQHQRENSSWYDIWGQILYPHNAYIPLVRK